MAGYKRIWHSGSISTYKSQVWLYPDADFGLFISTHGPHLADTTGGLVDILHFISDVLLGEPATADASTCSRADIGATNPTPPAPGDELIRPAEDYFGDYANRAFGNIRVFRDDAPTDDDDSPLRMTMGTLLTGDLRYSRAEDVFYVVSTGLYWFNVDPLPIRFRNSSPSQDAAGIDVVEVPLYGHRPDWATHSHVAFHKVVVGGDSDGVDKGNLANDVDESACGCASTLDVASRCLRSFLPLVCAAVLVRLLVVER